MVAALAWSESPATAKRHFSMDNLAAHGEHRGLSSRSQLSGAGVSGTERALAFEPKLRSRAILTYGHASSKKPNCTGSERFWAAFASERGSAELMEALIGI